MASLTPNEQANVSAGLTTDGRPIEPCICPDPDDAWWWDDEYEEHVGLEQGGPF